MNTELICTPSVCLRSAAADRQVTLTEQVEILGLDSAQATDQRGPSLVRQLVCVSMFMEYAFTHAVNLGLVAPPSHAGSPVTAEANGHGASFTQKLKL